MAILRMPSTSYLCRSLIRQKAQRINRRDKSLLSAKVASAKQQLLAAGRRTGTAGELARSESLRIESLLSTISQVDDLCAQARLGPHLARVGEVFGVQIKWSMSGRTVGCERTTVKLPGVSNSRFGTAKQQAKVEDAAAPSAVGRQPRTVERAGPGCDEAEGDEKTKQKCAKQSLRPMHGNVLWILGLLTSILADPIRHQRLNDTRRYNTHTSLDTCNHLNPQLGVARLNSGLFEGRLHMPLAGHQTAIN
ncbi:hypothetical protein DFH06DRAFT_1309053 [Mycena polygramma]|nr:hypothetical protein DFH06DRAFT_1309053 [Mycena polygramma]